MALEIGEIVEGKVSGIQPFGCFVDLPDGSCGLVHVSELAAGFVEKVEDCVHMGQTVKVKVLSVNEKGKISLSVKKALPPKPKVKKNKEPVKNEPLELSDFEWKPRNLSSADESFEDKMKRFKTDSDEKMQSLKNNEGRSRGYRRSSNSY